MIEPKANLMSLPAELRLQIYSYLLPDIPLPRVSLFSKSLRREGKRSYTALMSTCKLIYKEAAGVVYKDIHRKKARKDIYQDGDDEDDEVGDEYDDHSDDQTNDEDDDYYDYELDDIDNNMVSMEVIATAGSASVHFLNQRIDHDDFPDSAVLYTLRQCSALRIHISSLYNAQSFCDVQDILLILRPYLISAIQHRLQTIELCVDEISPNALYFLVKPLQGLLSDMSHYYTPEGERIDPLVLRGKTFDGPPRNDMERIQQQVYDFPDAIFARYWQAQRKVKGYFSYVLGSRKSKWSSEDHDQQLFAARFCGDVGHIRGQHCRLEKMVRKEMWKAERCVANGYGPEISMEDLREVRWLMGELKEVLEEMG